MRVEFRMRSLGLEAAELMLVLCVLLSLLARLGFDEMEVWKLEYGVWGVEASFDGFFAVEWRVAWDVGYREHFLLIIYRLRKPSS